jgi:hypothetical protein
MNLVDENATRLAPGWASERASGAAARVLRPRASPNLRDVSVLFITR